MDKSVLSSNKQFAEHLTTQGISVPTKTSLEEPVSLYQLLPELMTDSRKLPPQFQPYMLPVSPVRLISWRLEAKAFLRLQKLALSLLMSAFRGQCKLTATRAAPALVEIHRTLRAKASYETQFALLVDTIWLWATSASCPRLKYSGPTSDGKGRIL